MYLEIGPELAEALALTAMVVGPTIIVVIALLVRRDY